MVEDVAPRRPWALWLVGLLALAGVLYAAAGYSMAGSFSAADPARLAHWQRVARGYLALLALSLVVLLCAAAALLRARTRHAAPKDRAA